MTHFIASPIAAAVVEAARQRFASGDITVERRIVPPEGGYPCRRCLRDSKAGEAMLLFLHRPFDADGPYAESGAVFAHETPCAASDLGIDEVPEVTRVRAQQVVRAYTHGHAIHDAALTPTADVADTLRRFFDDAAVAYAHVRNVAYGCFAYRVDRA